GTESSWNFRRGGSFDRPYKTGVANPVVSGAMALQNGGTLLDVATNYQKFIGGYNLARPLSANIGDTLKDHNSDSDTTGSNTSNYADGFWSLRIAALSYAVDFQVPLAQFAYYAVTSAANYSPQTATGGFGYDTASDSPHWFTVPRNLTPAPFQVGGWLNGKLTFEWVSLPSPSTSPAPSTTNFPGQTGGQHDV